MLSFGVSNENVVRRRVTLAPSSVTVMIRTTESEMLTAVTVKSHLLLVTPCNSFLFFASLSLLT